MSRLEYLLVCLFEECAEVSERVSKGLRFTLEEVQPGQPLTNADRIAQEADDLCAVLDILRAEGHLPPRDPLSLDRKIGKLNRYMQYSRERGTLE